MDLRAGDEVREAEADLDVEGLVAAAVAAAERQIFYAPWSRRPAEKGEPRAEG